MRQIILSLVFVVISFAAGFLLHDSLTSDTSLPTLAAITPTPSPIIYAKVKEVLDGKLKYAKRLQSAQLWAKDHHNGMWIEEWKQ